MKRLLLITVLLAVVPAAVVQAAYTGDKETQQFLAAKAYVFEREWDRARGQLESYLDRYPEGRFEEEARYWLARSINQLSREAKHPSEVIRLKERAIEDVDVLLEKYPDSIWKDDAQILRLKVAAQLALLGDEEQLAYIREVVSVQETAESELMLFALQALISLGPEISLPMVESILNENTDPEIRKRAVTLVGGSHGEIALPLLRHLEAEDADPEIRKEAEFWRKKIEMLAIPVALNYFGYVARLEKDQSQIPENELKVSDFPALRSPSKRDVEKAVKRYFDGALSDVRFAASATVGVFPELAVLGYSMKTAHNLAGFRVEVPAETIVKSYFDIKGSASFFDKHTDKKYLDEFVVDKDNARLLAARRGEDVAILILIFESDEAPWEEKGEPEYYTKINNVFGAVVHSSRQSWGSEEMSGSVVEYGRARAEIAGDGGTWVMVGDIQLHRKTKRFVGRDATLYNPKREVVVKAVEIIVPAEAPETYEVKEKN